MKKVNKKLIFGDLLEFFDIIFPGSTLNEIFAFYWDFINQKNSLLEVFTAFVVSKRGFTYDTGDDIYIRNVVDFDEDEWIEAASELPFHGPHFQAPAPFGIFTEWDIEFVKNDQKLVVTILSGNPIGSISAKDGLTYTFGENLAQDLPDTIEEDSGKKIFLATNESIYSNAKEELKKLTQKDPLVSPDELLNKFTDEGAQRKEIKESWKSIREKTLERFWKTHPTLERLKKVRGSAYAGYDAEDLIIRARSNFEKDITTNEAILGRLRRALIKKLKKRFEIPRNKKVKFGFLFGTARKQLKRSRHDTYFDDVEKHFMEPRNSLIYHDNPLKDKAVSKAIIAVEDFCEKIEDMKFHEDKVLDEIIKEPPISKGDTREVKIESKGDKGDGVARIGKNGFIVFIPNTNIDEEVKVEITEVKPTFAIGEKIEG